MSMELLPGIDASASALQAEQLRQTIIAQNIANAQTTRTEEGGAYKRKVVAFESVLDTQLNKGSDPMLKGMRVAEVKTDNSPGVKIYNPNHPHADAEGMVEQSNVKNTEEMVALYTSTHNYEANLAMINQTISNAKLALTIGKTK